MKRYKDFITELTPQQRIKMSLTAKISSRKAVRTRKITMRKPPSAERIDKALTRAVHKKALAIVDKAGEYRDASAGVKSRIEKRAAKKVAKLSGKWKKRLKPAIVKGLRDAWKVANKKKVTEGTGIEGSVTALSKRREE